VIDFYYAPTPNGWKVGIMLEECGLDYRLCRLHLSRGEQFADSYLRISPNAKMPAIVDHDVEGDAVSVFESGAILIYLAEKTDQFIPSDAQGRREMHQWMFWQVGNQGPMAGQLSHFVNYAPQGQDYSLQRYKGEYERNLAVLDNRLAARAYILGDYSIVDMIAFPWAFIAKPLTVSLESFPNVIDWRSRIKCRPAVIRAVDLCKAEQNRGEHNAENNALLFNQSADHLRGKKIDR
jgi:GST-like protein